MLQQQAKELEQEKEQGNSWIQRTSQKILAIGAGLVAFMKYTDRVAFASEPVHQPDMEFIEELVQLLQQTAPTTTVRQSGDD
jgi:hypothetical protein